MLVGQEEAAQYAAGAGAAASAPPSARDAVLKGTSFCRVEQRHPNSEWRRDLVFPKKGLRVEVRPMTPDDDRRELEFFDAQTPQERIMRFMGVIEALPPGLLRRLTHTNFYRDFAIVAVDRASDQLAGVARYGRYPEETHKAEVAVAVLQRYQGLGLGRYLVAALFDAARQEGIEVLVAETLVENEPSRRLVQKVGRLAGAQCALSSDDEGVRTYLCHLGGGYGSATSHPSLPAATFERATASKPAMRFKVDDSRHPRSLWRHDLVFEDGLKVEVRPGDVDDRARLASFLQASAAASPGTPGVPPAGLFDFSSGFVLVALDMASDQIVAVAQFHHAADRSHLDVRAAPDYTGYGIADFLTQEILSAARSEVMLPPSARL